MSVEQLNAFITHEWETNTAIVKLIGYKPQ